uniref:ATP synthase complex subunit 8 n=1 Tax=Forcipiger flavissimus TaxID=109909 RepID=Q0ZXS5_FORFL|nr:ATP synthase F0 subunit 8 [Forcipiger flavissimus]ABA11386.1 ATPase subunit 8 [Forcipiger flavissimus]ABA11388.1 ATPase subunit 8 [Forcipiger flavissimus]ABA11390.1 ATPase subunit 8 [Forcipiger flavissimus]ABA11392.1 ATPase subunit 8 [Forcipiger flavissimus]ABA11394.1 ATPase subunit 8 [Forcipiger flavissimus]
MPQLDPAPWFKILVLSWFIFLTVIPPKIMAQVYPNELNPLGTKKPETKAWVWPWY